MFDFDVITGPTVRAQAEKRTERAPNGGDTAPPATDGRSAPAPAAEVPLVTPDPPR
jgi:hypothetical protein